MWRRLPDREGLLLVGPAAPTPDAGDHLEAAKAFGVRTGGTTMSTHRSRARPHSSGSTPSTSSANLQGGPQTAVTEGRAYPDGSESLNCRTTRQRSCSLIR